MSWPQAKTFPMTPITTSPSRWITGSRKESRPKSLSERAKSEPMLNPATREFAAPGRFALTLPLPGTRAREIPTRPKILIAARVPLDNFTCAQTLPTWVPQVSRQIRLGWDGANLLQQAQQVRLAEFFDNLSARKLI